MKRSHSYISWYTAALLLFRDKKVYFYTFLCGLKPPLLKAYLSLRLNEMTISIFREFLLCILKV